MNVAVNTDSSCCAAMGDRLFEVVDAEWATVGAGAGPAELIQASLMAFAGVNCQNEVDELALINWRATRLAGALGALDFGGPFPRKGAINSGDAHAHHPPSRRRPVRDDPRRPRRGEPAPQRRRRRRRWSDPLQSVEALAEAAKDIHTHRAIGDLKRMTD